MSGEIGLLSIDIDGNDYWVLEAIDSVSPQILVAEYNSLFGPERAVTVPYDAAFVRGEKHYSHLYWGASLAALVRAAETKGLALVGGNRAGNNAFFVRRDTLGGIPERTAAELLAAGAVPRVARTGRRAHVPVGRRREAAPAPRPDAGRPGRRRGRAHDR